MIAAVDPNDREVVYIGGVDLLRTTDGGDNWTQMTNWSGNCGLPEVHADQHQIVYQAGNSDVIYFGNDGGIYRTTDGSAVNPTFERKEFNYNTTQFYSVAMHPSAFSPEYVGGTQDNGSNKVSSLGISTTVESTGGDGGFAHIDQNDPNVWITAFTNANISRSLDGGLTFSTILANSGGSFINPSDYDNTSNVYYAGFSAGTYFFSSSMTSASNPTYGSSGTVAEMNGGTITHVSVSQNTANRVFFGLNNGQVVRVDNANTSIDATDISDVSFPSGSVSCIAVEDGDDDHLLVTFSNYGVVSVWESVNGGTTWTDVEGDLPDMPVRWALFNPNNSDEVIIATELGVWSTDNLDGAATEWEPSNDGLANVRTDMLQIRSSDNLVVAATHGRGLFTSDIFTSENVDFVADRTAIYAESAINFTDASYKATSWEWDFGDGGTSTEENPTHIYQRSGKYPVTLTINGGAATDTKTDYIHVLPNLPTPFTAADGGNFETNPDYFGSDVLAGGINLWERGTPANAVTTLNSGTNGWKTDLDGDIVEADYSSALYSPNFNMSAAGTYTLSFRKGMEVAFANAPQTIQVQYSTDNGNNWTRLGTDNDPDGTNWYERGPSSTFAIATDVVNDRYGFSNFYTNELTEYDISFLAGNSTVAFRFVHYVTTGYSAAGYQVDGFMVDDFEITGTVNEANTNITDNNAGSALSFDGVDDYATLSDLSVDESFTTEMWLSPESSADGQTFLAKHDASGNDIFGIGYKNGGLEVTVGGESVSGGSKTTGLQHLAVTVDKLTGTTCEVTVYRNGIEVFQNTVNDVIGNVAGLDWVIGQDWDGIGVPSDFYNGTIDELRIWNTVRTAEQIRENNYLIVDALDTDLVGYWQFNENAGNVTADAITGNEGTLFNGSTWVVSTASVAKGTSSAAAVNADGLVDLGSLDINFTGVSGAFDVIVFELDNAPSGVSPSDDFTLEALVDDPFYVINVFGTGGFTSADLVYNYGTGVFTETDPSRITLFKRPSASAGSWTDEATATAIDVATGVVSFDGITSFSQTTIGVTDATLPVELRNFSGKRDNATTRLTWETLSESDNDRFEILRSTDGEKWSKIGTVSSGAENGNSADKLSYSFSDRNNISSGLVYYRLRQIDFDGQFEMSDMIAVVVEELPSALKIYPNPVKDQLSLFIGSDAEKDISLEVIGINGKSYFFDEKLSITKGEMIKTIEVSELNDGLYFLVYRSENEKQTIRFIVSK
ncbi:MAG: LamG-like jellyroll fold domain-containing protein [Cyclobacteriaceae bacterium]